MRKDTEQVIADIRSHLASSEVATITTKWTQVENRQVLREKWIKDLELSLDQVESDRKDMVKSAIASTATLRTNSCEPSEVISRWLDVRLSGTV